MKPLLFILFLFCWKISFSQEYEILKLAFKDSFNFDITRALGNIKPTRYYVLNKTNNWNRYRFHIDDDLTTESVIKKLKQDEHSRYNHSYSFKDTLLNKLFNESEKQYLIKLSKSIQPRQLIDTFKVFRLVKSFKKAKSGFFFSVSEPIYSQNKQFAFLDITTFKKDKETKELKFAYFSHTLLIYKNLEEKGWTRIKKIDYLIL